MKDFYAVLGVTETANETEIKRAYRELARRYHPDVADSPEADTKFKEINEAYNVLSNSLKRADYDQTRRPKNAPEGSSPKEFRRLVTEGLGRVFVYAGVFGLIGASIDLVLLWLGESDTISFMGVIGGLSAGLLTGIIWGIDQNFVVETFLGESRAGRTYTFLRTVILALSGAYFLGRIVAFGEMNVGGGTVGASTLIASTIGLVIGATFGSDGETWHKLFSGTGRFELFYTMLRGLMVGAVATLITGAVIGMFHLFGVPLSDELWILFIGFALGMIVGAMRPANLSAYSSYASASIRTTLFALIILGTLIIGVTLGIIGRDFFSGYL